MRATLGRTGEQHAARRRRAGIRALLEAGLPLPEPGDGATFLCALDGEALAGCVGWEPRGAAALLDLRGGRECAAQGVGSALVEALTVPGGGFFLLTLSAQSFFGKRGFEPVARRAVPEGLLASSEFRIHHCCDGATVMRRELAQ